MGMLLIQRTKRKKGSCALAFAVISNIISITFIILTALTPLIVYAENNPPKKITVKQVFNRSDGTFTYKMKPLKLKSRFSEEYEEYTFTIVGTDSVDIELPKYNQQGIYRHELFQLIDKQNSCYTYDERVYMIEEHVDDELNVNIIILDEDGKKIEEIIFYNVYNEYKLPPTDPNLMQDPHVRKTVFGNPDREITFSFKLEATDPAYPMPAGSINGVKTIYITGSGRNQFGSWSYDKEGTYYYRAYEVNTNEKGYTYDKAVYTITDTVKEYNGSLALTRIVTNNANKPVTSLIFNNYYHSDGWTNPPDTTNPPPITSVDPTPTNPPYSPSPVNPPIIPTSHSNPPSHSGSTGLPNLSDKTIMIPTSTVSQNRTDPITAPDSTNPPEMTGVLEPQDSTNMENTHNQSTTSDSTDLTNLSAIKDSQTSNWDNAINGPKTGDDSNINLYSNLFIFGGTVSIFATCYLIAVIKRERRSRK